MSGTAESPLQADQRALEAFLIENPELETLEDRLSDFNIFEALSIIRQELRHSDFLAYLLNPQENHGLGDLFATRLLQRILLKAESPGAVSPVKLDIMDLGHLEVRREWHSIDILLVDSANRLVVLIENKVDSGEHSDQLKHYYDEVVAKHFAQWKTLAIYLTRDGLKPSDCRYLPADYGTVCEVVEEIVTKRGSTMGADVRTLVTHYGQMLRRHIVTESEIAELCRGIYRKHKRALDLIYEHRPDLQSQIREILCDCVNGQPALDLDHCAPSFVRFALKEWDVPALHGGAGWSDRGCILLFQFDNGPSSLRLRLIIGPGDEGVRSRLHRMALDGSSLFQAEKQLYAKWNTIYQHPFLTLKDYEDPQAEEIREKIEKRWSAFTKDDLPKLRDALKSQTWVWPASAESGSPAGVMAEGPAATPGTPAA